MTDPRRWIPKIRRLTYMLAALGVIYLAMRYSVYSLDAPNGVLPMRFESGQNVLLDTRPRAPEVEDAYLVRTAEGGLALGVVKAVEGDRLAFLMGRSGWEESDWFWIPRGDLQARILFILPF
ncbi:MAG: hypothetical protein P1V35_04010 [Planctomycetota bacterium]|nr:hypothetical protein [Planctomycetota bacterium]